MSKNFSIALGTLGIPTAFILAFSCQPFAIAQCVDWNQRTPATSPQARAWHAMAYDGARHVSVLFGGATYDANYHALGDTWEWNGSNWSQRAPATAPSPREAPAMAFDSARGVTVLFGGLDTYYNGETWEWNGTNWNKRTPVSAPSPRRIHAMAYDIARGVTVLFGGQDAGNYNGETWEWNGTNWTQRMPATSPSPRYGHAMAYDSARSVTVMFGGTPNNNETWEWNGTNWLQRSPATSPIPWYYDAIAFDSTHGVSLLFGVNGTETWQWNGTNWVQAGNSTSLSQRYGFPMVYDSARGVIALFGGYSGYNNVYYGDTWEFVQQTTGAPSISQEPANQFVSFGQMAYFSVSISGTAASYQWRRNGQLIANGGHFSGADTAYLEISNVSVAEVGAYDVQIVGCSGPSIISNPAALSVCSCRGDFNNDNAFDALDIQPFVNALLTGATCP